MEQQQIRYRDIINLGFTEKKQHDNVYFDRYGFDYCIIQLNLTNKIYIDWAKETRLCGLMRMNKSGDILNHYPIRDLAQLKRIIDFFN